MPSVARNLSDTPTQMTETPSVAFVAPVRPVLMLVGGGRRGLWELTGRDLVIGRDRECAVAIPADQAASRRHARLRPTRRDPAEIEIEDLGSLNGTLVNEVPIDRPVVLREHDSVRIGGTVFKYMLRDQDELEAERELMALATQDALTGLLNRGAFDHQLRLEFERSRRYERPLTLLMIDVDWFKSVNDRYGHVTGDRVLSEVGRVVRNALRGCDQAGRFGGEELVVLLPETDAQGGWLVAERIRQGVMDLVVHVPEVALRVTVSVGLAERHAGHGELTELVAAADRALYRAKNAGRNRSCVSPD